MKSKADFIKIGFAAESQDLLANAKKKLAKKDLDLIVANNVVDDGVFGSDDNKVILIDRDGQTEDLPVMSKRAVADRILDSVVKLAAH